METLPFASTLWTDLPLKRLASSLSCLTLPKTTQRIVLPIVRPAVCPVEGSRLRHFRVCSHARRISHLWINAVPV